MRFRHINQVVESNRAARLSATCRTSPEERAIVQLPPPQAPPRLGRVLLSRGAVNRATLGRALRLQRRCGGRLGDVLTANGWARRSDVDAALAEQARIPMADLQAEPISADVGAARDLDRYFALGVAPWRKIGDRMVWLTTNPSAAHRALAAMGVSPAVLRAMVSRRALEDALLRRFGGQFAADAAQRAPRKLSARAGLAPWHVASLFTAITALAALCVAAPNLALGLAAACFVVLAGASAMLRVAGLAGALFASRPHRDAVAETRIAAQPLPKISLIIALYRESATMPSLLEALMGLDYPPDQLEVIFALEADDDETISALSALALPDWARVLKVPPGKPRTKPRALNLALRFARGDIIGVYDAEDRPESDQLRKVARAFAAAPAKLACVQARLAYYNARESWIARCFAIEYHMCFAVLLKELADLGAPIPLGGTSMFIRREALESAGGWDAHNVTEDADLGMRLARAGFQSGVIDSTTWEEAAASPKPWIRQRSRWLKGFLQTWISQTRAPLDMARRLGLPRALAAQVILLVPPAMFLLQPVFWASTLYWLATGAFWMQGVFTPAAFALIALTLAEQATVFAAALLALKRRREWALAPWVFTLPFYWPMGAAAALKALVELVVAPSYWDKTTHGVGRIACRVQTQARARLSDAAAAP